MSSIASNKDLPNEIILLIFDYLDHDSLLQLTPVSPRFNRLALLVYFARRKVSISPDGQADLPNPIKTMEMLPYIRKAPFITSITRLSCGLLQPHKQFLEHVAHLTAILRKVDSVEEFGINFFVSSESWTPAMIKQANLQNGLYNALHDLLTTAARVSHTIMIRNGTSLRDVLQREKGGNSKRLSWSFGPALSQLFSPNSKSSKHQKTHVTQSPTASILPCQLNTRSGAIKGSLRALELNSILLLSPPFLNWTIQTLNANEITRLAFGTIEYQDVNWASLLSQLHLPNLTHLKFRGYTPLDALVDFLARHSSVRSLAIHNISLAGSSSGNRSSSITAAEDVDRATKTAKAFSNIKRLSCCPQGLVTLFSTGTSSQYSGEQSTAITFPNLQTISVLWGISIGQQLKMSAIADILEPIAHKLVSQRLVFVISYGVDASSTWRIPRSLSQTRTSRTPGLLNNNSTGATTSSPAITAPNLFSYFTEVKLEMSSRTDMKGVLELIERLAQSLTNVKRFKVDSPSGVGSFPEVVPKTYLACKISKQFKNLKMVSVGGVRWK